MKLLVIVAVIAAALSMAEARVYECPSSHEAKVISVKVDGCDVDKDAHCPFAAGKPIKLQVEFESAVPVSETLFTLSLTTGPAKYEIVSERHSENHVIEEANGKKLLKIDVEASHNFFNAGLSKMELQLFNKKDIKKAIACIDFMADFEYVEWNKFTTQPTPTKSL